MLQAYLREASALMCLHRPAEATAALLQGLQRVGESPYLQEALAALPGLTTSPAGPKQEAWQGVPAGRTTRQAAAGWLKGRSLGYTYLQTL